MKAQVKSLSDRNKKIIFLSKKIAFLFIAIVLMGFSQSILSYTSKIGMSPLDAFTKSFGSIFGMNYPQMNYIVVLGLIIVTLSFTKKGSYLTTSTIFITGFSLAFFVGFLSNYVVCFFPGLIKDTSSGGTTSYYFKNIWLGILWFFIGYSLLTIAIGIWINVNFAMRPYEALQERIMDRFEKLNPIILRNSLDLFFIILAIISSLISLKTQGKQFFGGEDPALTVGVGTIIIMFTAGYGIKVWKKVFSKIV